MCCQENSRGDQAVQMLTIIGYSLPTFLIAILFIWLFCSLLHIFPPSGIKTPGSSYTGWKFFTDRMYFLALAPDRHDLLLSGRHDPLCARVHD